MTASPVLDGPVPAKKLREIIPGRDGGPISEMTLWRYVSRGLVPAPFKVGNRNMWTAEQARDIAERIREGRSLEAA